MCCDIKYKRTQVVAMFLGCVLAADAINEKRSRVGQANASLLLVPRHIALGLAHRVNLKATQEFFRTISRYFFTC